MASTAKVKHLRVTPSKMRAVCNEVRGKSVEDSIDFLQRCRKYAALHLLKLLRSAVANADQKGNNVDALFVKEIFCDQGTSLKRSIPRARGSSSPILKRTCHVNIILDEKK